MPVRADEHPLRSGTASSASILIAPIDGFANGSGNDCEERTQSRRIGGEMAASASPAWETNLAAKRTRFGIGAARRSEECGEVDEGSATAQSANAATLRRPLPFHYRAAMPDNDLPFVDPAEECAWCPPREILARCGFIPLPPSELDEQQLPGRLWELLYAAAARRFFFHSTHHLSDREFYTLLWEQWLDEPTADIPLEAETNTTLIVSELNANGMTHEEIWLRYYAEETDRLPLTPDDIIPPHEDLPFDRDRHLPVPPIPLEAHAGWLSGDDDLPLETEGDNEPDPLGLAAVDREIAAARIEFNPGEPLPSAPLNPALEAQLRATEPENWTPPAEQLAGKNIPLLPPAEITDEILTPILWELLHNLSRQGFYVLHADHLSDRELYAGLWERGLRDPAYLPGRKPRGGWFHDFLGGWGEDDLQLWLRYYAADDERAEHAKDYPQDKIPPKEKPPHNRDWRLPKGPF